MDKKVIVAVIAGATAGITIYLVSRVIAKSQKRLSQKRINELKAMKSKTNYPYEYTL
jgi:NADP-dependent 3-hydroxy acid dehydrogenase YdfG